MKTYKVTETAGSIKISGTTYKVQHSYNAPYERNDLYLRLKLEKTPMSSQGLLEPDLGRVLYADVDYEYNYYAQEYEHATSSPALKFDRTVLPSLNTFLQHEAEIFPDEALYIDIVSCVGAIKEAEDPSYRYSMGYFKDYGRVLNEAAQPRNPLLESPLDTIIGFYKSPEIVSKDMYRLYLDVENKREMFPFFGKVVVEGIPDSQLANILETYKLNTKFIEFLIMHEKDNIEEIRYEQFGDDGDFNELELDVETIEYGLYKDFKQDIPAYDLNGFLAHIDGGHDIRYRTSKADSQSACNFFESFLMGQIGRTKIQEYITNSPAGTTSPIAFVVRKYSRSTSTKVLESVHYFFNFEEVTRFTLFDTQVTYADTTEYDIRVINSVISQSTPTAPKALIFLEEPYYREDFLLLDSPPIAPDVELITYRGISNKVLILFNQMVDKRVEYPVYINESDNDAFTAQYTAQNIAPGAPIMFESDDPTDFEIFKTIIKPSSYSEFANDNYRAVYSGGLTAASFKDTVVPNQTYYYMFRSLDIHGFCSNPSPIYEFTLIKEGETLYPRIRIAELSPPAPPTQKSKSFKKYLKIGLTPGQYQIPSEVSATAGDNLIGTDISIGTADELVIGSNRTFKFRLKSKNTGKLIDINVTFKKNKVIRA
tara:strand:- start:333 stop:2291 length:1959 start_codon:yes stop_codon:yes gene_type:complete